MPRQKQKKWQVCFEGEALRPNTRRRTPGKALALNRSFSWGGRQWRVPAVYRCAEGLVLDLAMRAPAGEIRAFMDRWRFSPASERDDFGWEQQMRIDSENPLWFDFDPVLLLNGRPLRRCRGHSACWNPVPGCHSPDDFPLLAHYGLDPADGWVLWRFSFPWKTRRKPPIRSLAVRLAACPVSLPGPRFAFCGPGDAARFVSPAGTAHTLTVREYARETLPRGAFSDASFAWPGRCVTIGYTVEPPLPRGQFSLRDCAPGDRPRRLDPPAPAAPEAAAFAGALIRDVPDAASVGIIGSADGPLAILVSEGPAEDGMRRDVSSLYFDWPEVEWQAVFRQTPCGPARIKLK